MRIRKNAKISTLFYTNSNLSNDSNECLLQKNLCQLNQSPWDIIIFPSSESSSPLHQFDDNEVYYNVNVAGNGSSVDSLEAFERKITLGDSLKTSEVENYDLDDLKNDYDQEILGFEEEEEDEILDEIVLCSERDEKGWQCGKVVKNGNIMCDHHLSKLQNDSVWSTKKKTRPVNPRQTKKRASSTNPYDFYYYSGFGPSWGKKRGSIGTTTNEYNKESTKIKNMSTSNDDDIHDMEKMFEPEMSKVGPTKMDNDRDHDHKKKGKKGIIGKKRGRKPMKARSLKSLM